MSERNQYRVWTSEEDGPGEPDFGTTIVAHSPEWAAHLFMTRYYDSSEGHPGHNGFEMMVYVADESNSFTTTYKVKTELKPEYHFEVQE